MKKSFLLLFIVSISFAQVKHSRQNDKGDFLPRFFIDLASYTSQDSGKSKLDVFIKVPHSNIQFLKTHNRFKANYSLIVSLYDDDEKLKLEKLWNEKVETGNFNQTVSKTSFNFSYKSFVIEPGQYKFVCRLEDMESRKYSTYEQKINIRTFKDSIDISDLVIVSDFTETPKGTKIIPNISNLVTSRDTSLSFFYEIYSNKYREVKISYTISNRDNESLYVKEYDHIANEGKNEINEKLSKITFTLGEYNLEIKISDADNNVIKGTRKEFASKLFGFPSSIKDLDLAVKQMQYIASPSDVDYIENSENYIIKLDKYLAYWKGIDPSPNTVENETLNEYYRRVKYADVNFKGYFRGWKSDMGMVYITLGPPDQVTRRPFQMDSKPYEIWDYYSLNRSFVFVDQTNFGDYRLENPSYGDWFRYRP